jgi:O-antigen/teichoic acid export membrane protein
VGFEAAIIQRKKDIDDAASTAFFIVILLCSMNYGLIFLFSKAIATFYKDQMIENVLKILSLTLIIGSFTRIHNFLLSKELQFGKKTICEIVPNIVYGSVSIPLALWRYGVWSIVYGEIAKYVVRSLLLILLSPWQPTFKFDFKIAKDLIAYGKHVMLHNFLVFGSENIDNAIVGKYFGLTHLSFYKMSYNAAAMPTQILYQIIGRVTLPAFSKVQSDLSSLKNLYFKILEYSSYIIVPAFFGLFLLASDVINILYGPKWQPAIPLFKALLVFGLANVIRVFSNNLFLATGRPSILPKITLLRIFCLVILLFSTVNVGLLPLCIGISSLEVALVFIQFLYIRRYYDVPLFLNINSLKKPFFLATVMAVVLSVTSIYLPVFNGHRFFFIFSRVAIGMLVYFLLLFVFERRAIYRFVNLKLKGS